MSRVRKSYRPRLSRDLRDRILSTAATLNGEPVERFPKAMGLICDWLDILQGKVDFCPLCASSSVAEDPVAFPGFPDWELPEGKWQCLRCRETFDVWDVLDVDDRESARLPGLEAASTNSNALIPSTNGTVGKSRKVGVPIQRRSPLGPNLGADFGSENVDSIEEVTEE